MPFYKTNKTAFSIHPNAAAFLNGLTANTLASPQNCFCDIHGKIIATFDQVKVDDEKMVIVLDEIAVEPVLKHLDKYAKLSGAKITPLTVKIYFELSGPVQTEEDEWAIPQKGGWLYLTDKDVPGTVGEDEFTRFRLDHHMPLLGVDFHPGEFLLNVSETDFVSFTKGCFLGQEPVAKVHNRSQPTWKLVVARADELPDEDRAKMTSVVTGPDGIPRGFCKVKNK